MKWMRFALATLVLGLAVSAVSAQSGALTIRVSDPAGMPLPGATVQISHETGFVKTTAIATNKDGLADFPVLRPGKGYIIEVSFPGRPLSRALMTFTLLRNNRPPPGSKSGRSRKMWCSRRPLWRSTSNSLASSRRTAGVCAMHSSGRMKSSSLVSNVLGAAYLSYCRPSTS